MDLVTFFRQPRPVGTDMFREVGGVLLPASTISLPAATILCLTDSVIDMFPQHGIWVTLEGKYCGRTALSVSFVFQRD
jgi:hypothetical protein